MFYVLAGCSHNAYGREQTWKWIQDNWDALKERLHPSLFSRGLQSVFGNFAQEERAVEIEEFLRSHKLEQGERGKFFYYTLSGIVRLGSLVGQYPLQLK